MKSRSKAGIRRVAAAAVTVAILGASLTACSGGDAGGGGGDVSAEAVDAALEKGGTLTYWSWTPTAEAQVAAFEKAYPNVDVKWVNAGQGSDQYTKLSNAIKAGSGGPDVAQIEYQALPQYALSGGVLDLAGYGLEDLEDQYSPSTWEAEVLDGKLYGLPQDSGPMAMFYNQAIFDQYGLSVPTTWEEYAAGAAQLHAANPDLYYANDDGNAGFAMSMIWQNGGKPFSTDGDKVTIDLQDDGAKEWTDIWNPLVEDGLVSQIPGFTDEWFKGLGNGSIATSLIGAWFPGILTGSVPDGAGNWRVAPMPTTDGGDLVTAQNGGGGQSVMAGTKNPALAVGFLRWLNSDTESIKVFTDGGGFPSTTAELTSSEFLDLAPEYFGGQKINEVLGAAADEVIDGWQYLPFQVYANSVFGDTAGQAYASKSDLNVGLEAWQDNLVDYGNKHGFTVNGG
jgi:multiple sugar transport system substrate-binding protein